MSENKKQDEQTQEQEPNTQATAQETDAATDNAHAQDAQDADEQAPSDTPEETPDDIIAKLTKQIEDEKKEYLFLMAEFDNFRKRTIREKAELIRNGAEKALGDILPIVDDFERAIKANENADNIDAVKEGFNLIYAKFIIQVPFIADFKTVAQLYLLPFPLKSFESEFRYSFSFLWEHSLQACRLYLLQRSKTRGGS